MLVSIKKKIYFLIFLAVVLLSSQYIYADETSQKPYIFSPPKTKIHNFSKQFILGIDEAFQTQSSFTARIKIIISAITAATPEDIYNATSLIFPPPIFDELMTDQNICNKEFRNYSSIIVAAQYAEAQAYSAFKNAHATKESYDKLSKEIKVPTEKITPEIIDYFSKEFGKRKRNDFLIKNKDDLKNDTISIINCAYIKGGIANNTAIKHQYTEYISAFKGLQNDAYTIKFQRGLKQADAAKKTFDKLMSTIAMIDEGTNEDVFIWAPNMINIGNTIFKDNNLCKDETIYATKSWGRIEEFSQQVYKRALIRSPETTLPEPMVKEMARRTLFESKKDAYAEEMRNSLKKLTRCIFSTLQP